MPADLALPIANRLPGPSKQESRKGPSVIVTAAEVQGLRRYLYSPLHGLLPGLVKLIFDPEFRYWSKIFRPEDGRQFCQRFRQRAHLSCHRVQEAHVDFQSRQLPAAPQKALSLHDKRLCSALSYAVGPRINTAECKTLPVFSRRSSIRIENIPLVEERIYDFIDCQGIHRGITGHQVCVSNRSIVWSHVGIPWLRL